jgi:hypothetical protein
MSNVMSLKRVGPYMGISRDVTRSDNGGTYRFIVYGAYNAYGLIGPEMNGIAVLDEDKKSVLCDLIAREDSGYFGPTQYQLNMLDHLMKIPFDEFKQFINDNPHSRYYI